MTQAGGLTLSTFQDPVNGTDVRPKHANSSAAASQPMRRVFAGADDLRSATALHEDQKVTQRVSCRCKQHIFKLIKYMKQRI